MKLQKKLLGSIALSALLLVGFTGCGEDSTNAAPAMAVETISPYTRVAVLSQANATDADIQAVADKIAHYVTLTDEVTVHNFPAQWVIAGANKGAGGETYTTEDLLPIPSAGTAAGGKSRIVEFCNGTYATMATNTGRFHGSALPCEVSVHSDGTNIYIDMLNADAIFSLFFTDISDPTGALKDVASAVNLEIRELVLAALDDTTVSLIDTSNAYGNVLSAATITTAIPYTESTLAMGPKFTQTQIDNEIALKNPYIVFEYSNGNTFVTGVDDKAFGEAIIAAMGTNGIDIYTNVPGVSAGSGWKSARPDTLAIPGVRVIEACSGKYATLATKLGNEYLTALPCEITVFVDETDNTKLSVSILSPNFMFGTMFQGAVEAAYEAGDINSTQVIEYSTLADVVFADLRLIVDQAVKNYDPSLTLNPLP
jgi:uncharacterized protein (DUF302 family)